jgi:nucleoside phosphorylase
MRSSMDFRGRSTDPGHGLFFRAQQNCQEQNMPNRSHRNPLHLIVDLLILHKAAFLRVHQAKSNEERQEALEEWRRCHPAVWGNSSSRNDTIRRLADPAKAWLSRANSRYVQVEDFNLVEECANTLSVFAISASPMAMPEVYSKTYTTEDKLWQQWNEQGNQLMALHNMIARLQELAARAGEIWTPEQTKDTVANQPVQADSKGGEMSKDATREFLMKVGTLKGMLNERARGGTPSEKDYAALRNELVSIEVIRDALPTFVLTCHTLQEFWHFIQPKFAKYKERTDFLQQEFSPILAWLEGGTASATPKPTQPPPPKPDVVVITVNKHETRAVLNAFKEATGAEAVAVPLDDRVYHNLGTLNGTTVYHAISEMGSGGAGGMQQTVDKAIRSLNPGAVIAVGIAFGMDESKQSIGDILVSKQLRLYELQRIGEESKIVLRGARPDAAPRLVNHFRGFADTKWEGASDTSGVIMTGEKLVDNVDYRKQLQAFESEAIGGEMEGAGLYVSGYDHKVDWIVVKAICDFADGNKGVEKTERQKLAAKNAAEFLVESLRYAPLKKK